MKGKSPKLATLNPPWVLIACAAGREHRRWRRAVEGKFPLDAHDGMPLKRLLANVKPNVLLLDLHLPHLGEIGGVREIQRLSLLTKIILFIGTPNDREEITGLRREPGIA